VQNSDLCDLEEMNKQQTLEDVDYSDVENNQQQVSAIEHLLHLKDNLTTTAVSALDALFLVSIVDSK
jgi:hypothetical protein